MRAGFSWADGYAVSRTAVTRRLLTEYVGRAVEGSGLRLTENGYIPRGHVDNFRYAANEGPHREPRHRDAATRRDAHQAVQSRGYSALRSSSLMEVLARVCASTRLTMTAQCRP